jgi:hypothetical protein
MAEVRREIPKDVVARAERFAQEKARASEAQKDLTRTHWNGQELAELTHGRVTEFPAPGYLDTRAVALTIDALGKLGLINYEQFRFTDPNLSGDIATYVVNDRTEFQVLQATKSDKPKIVKPASVAEKLSSLVEQLPTKVPPYK